MLLIEPPLKYWLIVRDGDPELLSLVNRHYSRRKPANKSHGYIGPGRKLLLRTAKGDAVFGWLYAKVEYRMDNLDGFNCTIFRNESKHLSSDMILEAEKIALEHYKCIPRDGFFTYVEPSKIKSVNPGYCFKKAGWKQVGTSKSGKIILKKEIRRCIIESHHSGEA